MKMDYLQTIVKSKETEGIFSGIRKALLTDNCEEVGVMDLKPGTQIPLHTHATNTEIYLVLSGTVFINGQVMHAGEFHVCDLGCSHECINISCNELAQILNIKLA